MAYEKQKEESYRLLGGINNKASAYANEQTEFRDLVNLNFLVPAALTKRPGTTLYTGATVQGRITGLYEFERLSGASYVVATANTNFYTVTPAGFTARRPALLNNALFQFQTFVDRLFTANGQDFFKFDGTNTTNYGLPPGMSGWGVTLGAGSLTGIIVASYGYINDRGYIGPAAEGITIVTAGNGIQFYGLTSPTGFGVSMIQLYRTETDLLDLIGTTTAPPSTTAVLDPGWPLTNLLANDNIFLTQAPKYLEIYNNQFFLAGFSGALSTVRWSQIGEPEGIPPEYFAEFRTNDGDMITGLKAYNNSLVTSKARSIHRVTGDDPTNFVLAQLSDQYGCVSGRALVVYENILLFLDQKGICKYDGAQIEVISNKVEPIFKRMNLRAALNNAIGFHYKEYNEVWFAFPVDDSEVNNVIIVYDYLMNAWTKYEGLEISSLALAKGALGQKTPFYGGYTGNIFSFGASYFSDNGTTITCSFDSHFLAQLGQTEEAQYRRFYLDCVPVLGVTQPITVNLKSNYGSTTQITRTMYQTPFQNRIDFGIPARSIQAQVIHASASLGFQVNGFSFISRFQRNV